MRSGIPDGDESVYLSGDSSYVPPHARRYPRAHRPPPLPRPSRVLQPFSRQLSNDLWRELTSAMFGAGAPS